MKTPRIQNVTVLCVGSGRTAEIEHSNGRASVLIREGAELADGLFAACDAEVAKAKDAMQRAHLYRSAAWHSLGKVAPEIQATSEMQAIQLVTSPLGVRFE